MSFRVATYINNHIEASSPDLLGALMINHGEQINLGKKGRTYEAVLAFMPAQVNGEWARVLSGQFEHEQFYSKA